jgi:cytochrome c oxidase subunit 4
MSTTTPIEDVHPTGEEHAHDHPSDFSYLKIALLLAAITACEVGSYFYKDATTTFLVITLLPMMTAKFLIVTGYFMHLKYDNKLFRRVFFFGLSLATVVFLIMLSTFAFWGNDYYKYLRK